MAPLIRILEDLRETARFAGREDLNGRIGMALAKLSDPRVRLVVVGRPRSGMSTVVNSLIGAPVSSTDGDGVPVIVEYATESAATLVKSIAPGRTERAPIDPGGVAAALAATDGVVRVEHTEPSPFLADGIVLMDAPGSTGDDHTSWSMIAAADAVLYVTDAGAEFDAEQLEQLDRIHRVCPTVVCVLTKIDQYPHWSAVQQRNRDLLDSAGLGLAVAPISAQLHLDAVADGDYHRDIESGLPQLVDHLRDFVVARADVVARDAAIGDIRLIAGHLEGSLRTEQESLRDPRRRAEITRRLSLARDEADQLRQRTANWQVTLVDGSTELMADIEHDLRHRLRSLVRDAEAEITENDPAKRWKEFAADLDARICEAVEENFVVAHYRSVELCEQVAGKFPAHHRMPPLPDLRLANPGEVLQEVAPLEPLESGKPGVTQQFLSALRGSYGGILMVGLATSLLGMSLVNWYSAGAGVLLGVNALWDDRKARKQRRRAEAKVAVARLMDDVVFQVGKESRNRLRAVQRALRDHFTELATEVLRGADEVLRVASEADGRYGHRRAERLAELERHLDELRGVRGRAEALAPF